VTGRDRIAAIVVGSVVLLAAFWFLALAPKRKDAQALGDKITSAQQRLTAARATSATAIAARDRYDADYAAVAKLGKAVPTDDDVASLVYQIDVAASGSHIDFQSFKLNTGAVPAAPAPAVAQVAATAQASGSAPPASGTSSTTPPATPPATGVPATQSAAAGLPPGSTVGSAGFPTMPFAFVFDGSFFDMERFFTGVQKFAALKGGSLAVRGRLLTVDSFSLTASTSGFPRVKASINATAYLVPQDQGLTAGATPQGPSAAAPAATGAAPASPPTGAPAAATSITGGAR
jgi:Tfp pilus assembly protein PilO